MTPNRGYGVMTTFAYCFGLWVGYMIAMQSVEPTWQQGALIAGMTFAAMLVLGWIFTGRLK